MKTSELTGALLDYWVARAEGYEYVDVPPDADGKNAGRALLPPGLLKSGWTFPPKGKVGNMVLPYSTNWAQGGPIIERERINLTPVMRCRWTAEIAPAHRGICMTDKSPLVAAMRAYVASKFGDEVTDA